MALNRMMTMYDATQGVSLKDPQKLDLLPIKWMYADSNLTGEGNGTKGDGDGAETTGFIAAAAAAATARGASLARAAAHRNIGRYNNVSTLPTAENKRIYLVFTTMTGTHRVGLYVTKKEGIDIVNWLLNFIRESGFDDIPDLKEGTVYQGGGGRRRKRKSHKRKTHKRKRTRRRRR